MVDWVYFLGLLLLVGALSGFSAGLFGIGGGVIVVPALFYVFSGLGFSHNVVMHCAVATSLAVVMVNSVRSVRVHNQYGSVDWKLLWPQYPVMGYGLWIGIGAFIAALWIAPLLSGIQLTGLYVGVISLISLQFIFGRPDWILRESMPQGAAPIWIGSSVGGLSALLGIGGGSMTVVLMSLCSVPIHRAIGTASGFGLAVAISASLGFILSGWGVEGRPPFSIGYVNSIGFLIVAFMAYFCVPLGARTANNLSQKRLRRVFGICLLVLILNMIRKMFL